MRVRRPVTWRFATTAVAALALAACLVIGGGFAWAGEADGAGSTEGTNAATTTGATGATDDEGDAGGTDATPSANVVTYLKDAAALSVSGAGGESGAAGEDDVVVALAINADGLGEGSITYSAFFEDEGWSAWAENGETIGALGGTSALKAIKVQLTGEVAEAYDVWYRVWVDGYGWTGWAKNGSPAGTFSEGATLEAVQVVVLAKDDAAPGDTTPAVITSAACVVDPGEADDLTGSWIQTGFEDFDTYLVGVIEDETITVYWRSLDEDGEEVFTLYWSGTYEAAEKGGAYSWDSLDAEAAAVAAEAAAEAEAETAAEETDVSDDESDAETEDTIPYTTFTYEDGVLSFEATALSVTGTVTMEQTELDVPAAIAAAEAAAAEAAAQAEAEAEAEAAAEAEAEATDATIQALVEALTEALAQAEAATEAATQAQAEAEAAAAALAEAEAAAEGTTENAEEQTSSDDADDSATSEDASQAEDATAGADDGATDDDAADDATPETDATEEPSNEESAESAATDDSDDADEEELADAATALAEPVVVVATDDLTITLTSLNAEGEDGYEIGVAIVNGAADTTYAVEATDECAADGVLCDAELSVTVAPGETLETVIVIADADQLAEAGVAFTDLLVALIAYDAENGSADEPTVEASAHVYPDGEESAVAFVREALATDHVLIDNDEMTVTIVGYTVELYIVNKTDASVTLSTDEEIVEDTVLNAAWSTSVPAGLSSFETLTRYLASVEEEAATKTESADETADASPEAETEAESDEAADGAAEPDGETITIEFTLKTDN